MTKNKRKGKKLPKFIRKNEMKKYLQNAKDKRKRDYLMMLTMYRAGLRVSELINLRKDDLDFDNNKIKVRQGKGNKDRYVPMERSLADLLIFYTDDMNDNTLIFPLSKRRVEQIVKEHTEGKYTPHNLRHTFSVHCVKNGLNIRQLQKLIGHSSLTTTQIYLDITLTDIEEDFNSIDNWEG